jgi:hypothetical protein
MAPSDGSDTSFDATSIAYLIHHVILPPKLPQTPETDIAYEQIPTSSQKLSSMSVQGQSERPYYAGCRKTTVFELLIPEAYSNWRDAS